MYCPIGVFGANVNVYEGCGEESGMIRLVGFEDTGAREKTDSWRAFSGCSEEVDILTS